MTQNNVNTYVLILYYSGNGHVKMLAEQIAQGLRGVTGAELRMGQ